MIGDDLSSCQPQKRFFKRQRSRLPTYLEVDSDDEVVPQAKLGDGTTSSSPSAITRVHLSFNRDRVHPHAEVIKKS